MTAAVVFLLTSSTKFSSYHSGQRHGFHWWSFLFSLQGLFDTVPCSSTDSSQGGGFSRCKGGRYECQERKESTSLTSLFATDATHGPSPSSTFGRHDVFETMKGTRCRHAYLGFSSVPRRRRRCFVRRCPPSPPPPPPRGFWGPRGDIDHRVLSMPPTPGHIDVNGGRRPLLQSFAVSTI